MTRALRIEPEALEELEAAVAWYDNERSGLGGDLLEHVHATLAAVSAGTLPSVSAGRASNGAPVRRVLLTRSRTPSSSSSTRTSSVSSRSRITSAGPDTGAGAFAPGSPAGAARQARSAERRRGSID